MLACLDGTDSTTFLITSLISDLSTLILLLGSRTFPPLSLETVLFPITTGNMQAALSRNFQ